MHSISEMRCCKGVVLSEGEGWPAHAEAWKGLALRIAAVILFTLSISWIGLGRASAATYYIDFAGGSNSNNGTSTTTPWKHVPGMPGCSSNCALKIPQAGDRFIFKGGVTWDHTCFEWDFPVSGSAGNPIYYGVDKTYFTGGSWTRPIFNGEHTTLGVGDSIVGNGGKNWITLDNIEIKGHRAPTNYGSGSITHGCATNFRMTNLYVHDWDLNPALTTDDAHGGILGNYPSCTTTGNIISNSVISNTEARNAGKQNGIAVRNTDLEFTTIFDVQTAQLFGILNNSHIYNVSYPSTGHGTVGSNQGFDPNYHENTTYLQHWDGVWNSETKYTRPGLVFNNLIHDVNTGSGVFYPNACPATGFYIFNNVVYNNFGNEAVQIDQYPYSSGTCGNYYIWNNTFEVQSGRNAMRQVPRGAVINILDTKNIHYIQDGGTSFDVEGGIATRVDTNNITQTHAAASTQGFTAADAYAPSSAANSLLSAGYNMSSECSPVSTWLCSSIPVGGSTTARPASGSWDIGAYSSTASSGSTAVKPPTNLTAIIN